MRGTRALLLGLATLTCYVSVYADVPDGTLLEDGYHYKKSTTNSNSNSYSQSNEENLEIDGALKGHTFKGEKKSGYSTSGASHSQSSAFASGSFSGNVPANLLAGVSSALANANANTNAELQSQVGFGTLPNPGTGSLSVQGGTSAGNEISNQISGSTNGQGGVQYWWMAAGSPFKPQGGCNFNGCSISGSFSTGSGGTLTGGASAGGSTTGGSFSGSSTSIGSTGSAAVSAGNPFLNSIHQGVNGALGSVGGHFGIGSQGSASTGTNTGTNIQGGTLAGHGSQGGFGEHFTTGSFGGASIHGGSGTAAQGGIQGSVGGGGGHFATGSQGAGFGIIHGGASHGSHFGTGSHNTVNAGVSTQGGTEASHGGHFETASHGGVSGQENTQGESSGQGNISGGANGQGNSQNTIGNNSGIGGHFGVNSGSHIGSAIAGAVGQAVSQAGTIGGHFGIGSHGGTSASSGSQGGILGGAQGTQTNHGTGSGHFGTSSHGTIGSGIIHGINGGINNSGHFGSGSHMQAGAGSNVQGSTQGTIQNGAQGSHGGHGSVSGNFGSGSHGTAGSGNIGSGIIQGGSQGVTQVGTQSGIHTGHGGNFGIDGHFGTGSHGSGSIGSGIFNGIGSTINHTGHFTTGVNGGASAGAVSQGGHGGHVGTGSHSTASSGNIGSGIIHGGTSHGGHFGTGTHGGVSNGNAAQSGIQGSIGGGSHFATGSQGTGFGIIHGGASHGSHFGTGSHGTVNAGVSAQGGTEASSQSGTQGVHGGHIGITGINGQFGSGSQVTSGSSSTGSGAVNSGTSNGGHLGIESHGDANTGSGTQVNTQGNHSGIGGIGSGSQGTIGFGSIGTGIISGGINHGGHLGFGSHGISTAGTASQGSTGSSSQSGFGVSFGIGSSSDHHVGSHLGSHVGSSAGTIIGASTSGTVGSTTNGGYENQQTVVGSSEQGYPESQKPQKPFETGHTIRCSGAGKICVAKQKCIHGFVSLPGISQVNNQNQNCDVASEVCCNLKKEHHIHGGQHVGGGIGFGHGHKPSHVHKPPHHGGSASGGLFGSGSESEGDLNAGDNSGFAGESNGYLPPIGGSPSSNVPAFSSPPKEPEDSGRDDQPTNTQPQFAFPPAPPAQPQLGCAAALICVEEQYCTMLGMISETPVALSSEQLLRRVPMVDCRNPDNGVIGKCCRDPNYVDPWPAGNLPANYSGGFDEQGFPTFLNISKTRPKKPVQSVQLQLLKPLRPQPQQNIKVFQHNPANIANIQPVAPQLQPQSTFQSKKVVPQGFGQVQQPVQPNFVSSVTFKPPQQPSFQPAPVVTHKQPTTFQPHKQPATFQPHQPSFSAASFEPQQPQQPEQPETVFQHQTQHQPEIIVQQPEVAGVFHHPEQPDVVQPQKLQPSHHFEATQPKQPLSFQVQKPAPFKPQQPAPFKPQQPASFQHQQPAVKFEHPIQTHQQPAIKFEHPIQTHQQPAVKFEHPIQTHQPGKAFEFPSFPNLQDIPNQISQLNPFKPQAPVEDTEVVNAPADVPEVPLPTTQRPGIFQDFPNNLPTFQLPSFPGFGGKGHESAPTNESPVVIAHHTPGAQCGIVNQVQHPGGLGAVDVAFGEIPWQAMILSNSEKKLLCSGAIVAPNLVLTAAHCVYGHNPSDVSIKAGEWKLGYELKHEEPLPFEIVQVKSIVAHPNYVHGGAGFDTAMLFLEKSIRLDQHIDTICVGDAPSVTPQRKCISTGWGKTILQVHAAGALMHKIDIDVLSNDQCRQRIQGAESPLDLDDSLVCAKAHKQSNNMCQVDVGGPLACDRGDGNYELVGVYSHDTGCLPTNQVATFALIDSKWVNSMMSGSYEPQQPEASFSAGPAPLSGSTDNYQRVQQSEQTRYHYHKPGVPCDCQQGTQPSGANQYLPPV